MPTTSNLVKQWMLRIANSNLSIDDFFSRFDVPFSRANHFKYKQRMSEGKDPSGLPQGRKRKIADREELFLRGIIASGSIPPLNQLRDMLQSELGTTVGVTAIHRCINRLLPNPGRSVLWRPKIYKPKIISNPLGGFELIIAVAYHLKWPDRVASIITSFWARPWYICAALTTSRRRSANFLAS